MDTEADLDMHFESRDPDRRMTWKTAPWLAFDFEATGTDPRKSRPIQFGYAIQQERDGPIETGEAWINPRAPIGSAGFLELTPDELTAISIAPDFAEHAPYLVDTIHRYPVVMGWNCGNRFDADGPGYDCPMFAAECARVHLRAPHVRVLDAMMIACQTVTPRPASWQLPDIAKHFGITFPSQAHRAGADSFVALSALEKMAASLPDDIEELHRLLYGWMALSWWLRDTPRGLELNCGKHRGMALEEVAPLRDRRGRPGGYLRWALGLSDLPPAIRDAFKEALRSPK